MQVAKMVCVLWRQADRMTSDRAASASAAHSQQAKRFTFGSSLEMRTMSFSWYSWWCSGPSAKRSTVKSFVCTRTSHLVSQA